jgi:hypothetical protein
MRPEFPKLYCRRRQLRIHTGSKFESRVFGKIFGSRMDEVTGEWRRLYNGELNNISP